MGSSKSGRWSFVFGRWLGGVIAERADFRHKPELDEEDGRVPNACQRLQGDADFPRFRDQFNAASGGAIPFGDASPDGPLASFECVDVWVDHPYRDGVALLGDAASSNDPSWGQGLSLAFRDARALSDELLADTDWHAAADRYAQRHDQHYGAVRTVSG